MDIAKEWSSLTPEEKHNEDLKVHCPRCLSAVGEECIGLEPNIVHFGRRLLAIGLKGTDEEPKN